MAGMKNFYVVLGVVAVIGGGWLFMSARGGGATLPQGPIPADAILSGRDFPGYVLGSEDAPVEIVEFADFQCNACQYYWLVMIKDVKERLVTAGKVRWVFRDFPLESHDKSRQAHHAAACADEQGLFEPMHDQLFMNQRDWAAARGTGETLFRGYAEQVGVSLDEYDDCMASGRYRGRIQASYDLGVTLGVSGTPTFVIGNQRYNGMSYDQMARLVDSLAQTSP